MKEWLRAGLRVMGFLIFVAGVQAQTVPVTNSVVSAGISAYSVNGQSNPTLTLERGVTYVFELTAFGHPFYIKTAPVSDLDEDEYTNGVTGNGSETGELLFTVPNDAPEVLYYHCGAHFAMGGELDIITPPSPPEVQIVFISLTESNITIQSTGPSNGMVFPEFNSNLVLNTWAAVPRFQNSFANGTNTTTFDRPDPICGPNVFLRVRNQR